MGKETINNTTREINITDQFGLNILLEQLYRSLSVKLQEAT